jgi:hypothetical protein
MVDDADRASIQQQNLVDAAIKKSAMKSLDTTNTSGVCWTCGKATGIFKRWCGVTCRDEWEQG